MHEKHWLTDGITIQHISSTNRHPRLAALRSSVPETNDTACNKAITAGSVIIKESTCVRKRLGAFVRVRHMHSDVCNDSNDRKRYSYFEFTGARKSAHESLFLLNIPHHYDCTCNSTIYTARGFEKKHVGWPNLPDRVPVCTTGVAYFTVLVLHVDHYS